MGDSYVGEIRMFGGTYAPEGWAFCNGQIIAISDNPTLYNLIGTTYGGDGQQTFALPNLQSRIPVHAGNGLALGGADGSETVTLTTPQIPAHDHVYNATTNDATATSPAGALLAKSSNNIYLATTATPASTMGQSIGQTGNNQPHPNIMPLLAVSFIISLYGVYPSQN